MAIKKRHQYRASVKAKVALEAVKGEKNVAQIASEFGGSSHSGSEEKRSAAEHIT